ncbi:OmpA family protein [Acaryochloris thomasi RCC1774]|uniref:OmpA family protein n=1 Tax=Acaryochloris thomasi RCC1774 TaxID=1764569 RepID=A0A2W1JPC2_9CYAN|nr:OmpA family protein [Acaryochloris thomasi]PZD70737.1 OmpA family protein [Acaryochloris thomasi RCC1774]
MSKHLTTILLLLISALVGCSEPIAELPPEPPAGKEASSPVLPSPDSELPTPSEQSQDRLDSSTRSENNDAGRPLTARVSDLNALVDELGGRVTAQEITVPLPADVLFDFDKAELRSDALPTLQRLADLIRESGDGAIQIEGHTDSKGEEAYNQPLSERRAQAVADWLTSQGIGSDRLRSSGLGESKPVAENTNADGSDNPEGRQQNRRVEVIIQRE